MNWIFNKLEKIYINYLKRNNKIPIIDYFHLNPSSVQTNDYFDGKYLAIEEDGHFFNNAKYLRIVKAIEVRECENVAGIFYDITFIPTNSILRKK